MEHIGVGVVGAGWMGTCTLEHLWIEKPVGMSLEETERVAAAVAEGGVVARVGNNYRFVAEASRSASTT